MLLAAAWYFSMCCVQIPFVADVPASTRCARHRRRQSNWKLRSARLHSTRRTRDSAIPRAGASVQFRDRFRREVNDYRRRSRFSRGSERLPSEATAAWAILSLIALQIVAFLAPRYTNAPIQAEKSCSFSAAVAV